MEQTIFSSELVVAPMWRDLADSAEYMHSGEPSMNSTERLLYAVSRSFDAN